MTNSVNVNMNAQVHILVPAAGSGQRFGGPVPKQYIQLKGKPVIQHSLELLLEAASQMALNKTNQIVIAISDDDDYWQDLDIAKDERIKTVSGGQSRAESVQNALSSLANVGKDDWVLIHDAVRPLVAIKDIKRLVEGMLETTAMPEKKPSSAAGAEGSYAGGLLATPIYETVKRVNEDAEVVKTEDRNGLWIAQTPQMFRYDCLVKALDKARSSSKTSAEITDEALAVEAAGYKVKLINGSRTNIKITRPEDLEFAELILGQKI